MLVVMQQGATEEQIQNVIDRLVELDFDVHRSTGVMHTVLGGVGGRSDFDLAVFEVMEGVKEAQEDWVWGALESEVGEAQSAVSVRPF